VSGRSPVFGAVQVGLHLAQTNTLYFSWRLARRSIHLEQAQQPDEAASCGWSDQATQAASPAPPAK
jgi:hypothetical protein